VASICVNPVICGQTSLLPDEGRRWDGNRWQQSDQLLVEGGWNVVEVLDANASSNAVKIKYTWGLDLSGSVQGAGGIGGRLALDTTVSTKRSGRWPAGSARSSRQGLAAQDLRSRTKNYWFLYDANGNAGSEPGRS